MNGAVNPPLLGAISIKKVASQKIAQTLHVSFTIFNHDFQMRIERRRFFPHYTTAFSQRIIFISRAMVFSSVRG